MSSVPKGKREKHDFITSHKMYEIRRTITELAINDFGYDKEKLEERIKRFEQRTIDIDNKEKLVEKWRLKNESYYADFVQEETLITRQLLRDIVSEFELGNSIFPSGEFKTIELNEKRIHLDLCIGKVYCLKQELQYIAETLPCDINKYEHLSDQLKELAGLVKGVRRSANKYID